MTSVNLIGVHLLPSTGEFAYDIYPAVGAQRGPSGLDNLTVQNTFSNPSLAANVTDYTNSIEQLQAQHPECTTVSVVVAWFFNSEDASTCQIYPSTNFILGEFQQNTGSGFLPVHWMVSSLTEQSYPGLIPIPEIPNALGRAWLRLWRDAERSIDRSLHSRFKDTRFQSRILPVLARNGCGLSLARAHYVAERHLATGDERCQHVHGAARRPRILCAIRSI